MWANGLLLMEESVFCCMSYVGLDPGNKNTLNFLG